MISRLAVALTLAASLLAQEPRSPASGSVVGLVLDALGEPVPLAEVWVTRWSSDEAIGRAKADGSGMFSIGRLPEGEFVCVRATADGKTVGFDSVRSRPDATCQLRLWDAGTVAGRVVDAAGKPIAGAEVAVTGDARNFSSNDTRFATSDSDGHYEFANVPLGSVDVRAIAPGCVLGSARIALRDRAQADLVLQSGDGVQVIIRVKGIEAQALRDVRVSLHPQGIRAFPRSLAVPRLTADGEAKIAGLPDADYTVRISDNTFVFQPREHALKMGLQEHEVVFSAVRPTTVRLRGTLRGPQNEPLPQQTLVLRAHDGGREALVTTDAEGKFEADSPLAPGEHFIAYLRQSDWVLAQPKDDTRYGWDKRFWGWHEGVVDPDATIELRAEPEVRVSGRVVDREGRPVPFVRVELQCAPQWNPFAWGSTTDRDGRFDLNSVRAATEDVRLVVEGRSGAATSEPFRVEVGRAVSDLELRLDPPAIIEGVVRDAQGTPVPGARVWLRNWDMQRGRQRDGSVDEVLTDRLGRYRHIGVAPGGHYLQLYFEGYTKSAANTEPFEVAPGQRVKHDF